MAFERLGGRSGVDKRVSMRPPTPPPPVLPPAPTRAVQVSETCRARAAALLEFVASYLAEHSVDRARSTDNATVRVFCLERLGEWCARELQHERGKR